MEKRLKKTLARTFGFIEATGKLFLSLALFAPTLALTHTPQQVSLDAIQVSHRNAAAERIRPRELVKINAILRSQRPGLAESESWRLSEVIFQESSKRHLDPLLVTALIQVESGFNAGAVSPVGARGMMQIMPETGKFLAHALAREYGFKAAAFTPESLDEPVFNLRLGIYYLHDLKKQFEKIGLALTAYNCGPAETLNRIENDLDLPDEFASLVLDAYRRHKNAKTPAF
jgi:soluble lytic murein transglycosylase-like protein